ncbi:MAG: hypothetical protein A2Z99_05485 [Treponema sp. GWB1_62_6]|nr:MAG: hypothetical protein A2Y36_17790 [Treponema sp. GWA1_62_8]OHE63741.1 MAG: hypothetical protein A2001_00800 [Treponema sp. GWC1_61_84]OHE69270.1 MAG: hypothetical protein A2413_08950 [Treponema sp. RIFOXYC1_FULL_61_9]OHE72589.1 MAG: hypothetical protein A2Z99_05485 [Treponema sp. GWB1_62_6]HCM28019.1 hypothetical protein [Treponema sp.]
MVSDYDLLGIKETAGASEIKSAFRKRVKELHPDTTSDGNAGKNHFLFVEICKAYQRLCGKHPFAGQEPAVPANGTARDGPRFAVAEYSDPAYAYYRNGIRYFSKIHPSQWNIDSGGTPDTKLSDDDGSQDIIRKKVKDLVSLFPKAYYYFSIVVNEYPDSIWAADSREKTAIIEERMIRYRHIIESFSAWNDYGNKRKARYEEMSQNNDKRYHEFKDGFRKKWEEDST